MTHYRISSIKAKGVTRASAAKLSVLGNKKYIFVAGLDYPSHHNAYKIGSSFGSYSTTHAEKIIKARKKGETITIIKIDILLGTVTTTDYLDASGPIATVKNYDAVTKDNYDKDYNFITNGKSNIISKQAIYKFIEQIGKDDPSTLYQVDIFSHAYWNGPILVDSLQNIAGAKNPDDYDMRISDIDSIIDKGNFKAAFAADAKVKIWGCSFPRDTNALFSKLRRNEKYTTKTNIPDDTIFNFKENYFLTQYLPTDKPIDLTLQINQFLKTTFDVKNKIQLTFLQIKKLAAANYLGTYAATLTNRTGISVQAALPATYAEIDPDFHIAPMTIENVIFYQKHLGVTLGELKYGIYNQVTYNNLYAIYTS